MALTLPYPSLVFVPLDILTADQMNEIVANYEYIANQFPIGASNIDFTTFTTNLPATTKTQALGYTSSGTLIRVANVVVLQSAGSFNASPGSGWISLAETVAQGYRPNSNVYCWVQTQSASTFGQYEFSADGSIRLYNSGIGTGWHAINGVWITEDAWPSS